MKKRVAAFIALITLAVPTICLAAPPRLGPYVSGFIGVSAASNAEVDSDRVLLDDQVQFDPGPYVGATGGFDFGFLRLEGELSYRHAEIDRVVDRISGVRYSDIDGDLGVTSFIASAYLDLHNPTPITPYFGGGLGFASLHQESTSGTDFSVFPARRDQLYRSDDATAFAYQVGAGVEIELNRLLSLDIGYRYFRTEEATFNEDTFFEDRFRFESHNAAVGVRVKF